MVSFAEAAKLRSDSLQSSALNTLDLFRQFREAGGVERVVALLESSSDDVRRAASWAMSVLAADPASSLEVCKHG